MLRSSHTQAQYRPSCKIQWKRFPASLVGADTSGKEEVGGRRWQGARGQQRGDNGRAGEKVQMQKMEFVLIK